jgi:hypothetical protein
VAMNIGRTVFSQLMDLFPLTEFRCLVAQHAGEYKAQSFSCLDQFLCMAFAQLTYRESLRDIEVCLRSLQSRLYHAGFRGQVSRNTPANANEHRDWRIYAGIAQVLIARARRLYAGDSFSVEIEETAYALDSTTIDLCLSLFPWAPFQQSKSAIKAHTLLDLRGNIPSFLSITTAHTSDVSVLDQLIVEPGAFYIMDRGYIDFQRLYRLTLAGAFFVVRAHDNMHYRRRYSHPVDKSTGLRCDQTIVLTGRYTDRKYPAPARLVRFVDQEHALRLSIFTNQFVAPALTIAQLYKARWNVELFFKWIKQHLRSKKFYGYSANAVKTQIWIAVSTYLLVAILKKQLNLSTSLYRILQILSLTLFEKMPILQALQAAPSEIEAAPSSNQLILFD